MKRITFNVSILVGIMLMVALERTLIVKGSRGQPYGGNLEVGVCSTAAAASQQWQLPMSSLISPAATQVSLANSAAAATLCWDVESFGQVAGSNVQVYDCQTDGRLTQQWIFYPVKNNQTAHQNTEATSYQIASAASKLFLDIAGAMGTNAQLGNQGQVWNVEVLSSDGPSQTTVVRLSVPSSNGQSWCLQTSGIANIRQDVTRTGPLVIGHRGTATAYPENTMPAFYYALSNYADGIESDLRLTKDGQIVMIHDATLDRTTNCSGQVSDYTLEQLQSQCDACSWFDPQLHCSIPTFNQTIELLLGMVANQTAVSWAFLVMDLKIEGLAKPVANSLSALPYSQSRVLASCWTQTQVEDFAAVLPAVVHHRLSSSLIAGWQDDGFWANEVLLGLRGYSISQDALATPDGVAFMRAAHAQMMTVVAWTLTGEADTLTMIQYGANSLICDSPLLCQQMVEKVRQTFP